MTITGPDLDELSARHSPAGLRLELATPAMYDEVEQLARAADPAELFEPIDARLLRWFIETNPHGPGFLVLARPAGGGPIVGHFLFYAQTLVQGPDRRLVPALLYVNLYVAPSYRRRGVFAAMFAFGRAIACHRGVPVSYTVPNPRSSPGFTKFGVPRLGTLSCWMAPVGRWWRAWPRLTATGGADIDVTPVTSLTAEMLANAGTAGAEISGLRTPETVAWRFSKRPGVDYTLWSLDRRGIASGYAVTRLMTIRTYRVLALCDVRLADDGAGVWRRLMDTLAARAAESRADLLLVQGGSPERAAALSRWRAGLVYVPDRFLPQPVVVFGGAPGTVGDAGGLPSLDRWYLTPGDWDVF